MRGAHHDPLEVASDRVDGDDDTEPDVEEPDPVVEPESVVERESVAVESVVELESVDVLESVVVVLDVSEPVVASSDDVETASVPPDVAVEVADTSAATKATAPTLIAATMAVAIRVRSQVF